MTILSENYILNQYYIINTTSSDHDLHQKQSIPFAIKTSDIIKLKSHIDIDVALNPVLVVI